MMVEILSPAGDFETLVFAINAGADAIYLGGNIFNARANATNFSDDEIVEAVKYAHLRNVKIYVTVNIIVFQDETDDFIKYCDFLYKNNVDGLILQDVGLAYYLKQRYDNIEIHISTQVNTHNLETVKQFKELGFDRVVLARELDFERIAILSNIDGIDTEVFVHGALCISHSGQCLMSYLNGGRSGNRGLCAQICRLPIKLFRNNEHLRTSGKYLLSPQDVNNSELVSKYLECGVSSLKIEGRMKSKEYAYKTTSNYRSLVDGIEVNNTKDLQKLYSRGFTNGYVNGYDASKLIGTRRPNHQGVKIGTVSFVGNAHLEVKLIDDIAQGDGLRIISQHDHHLKTVKLYKDGLLVNSGSKGDIIEFEFTNKGIRIGDPVLKTKDILLEKSINTECNNNPKRISIDINLVIHNNQDISVTSSILDKIVLTNFSYKPEIATNKATTIEDVEKTLSKLGNTSFIINKIEVSMNDNLFIPLSILKQLRNKIVEDASLELLNVYCDRKISEYKYTNRLTHSKIDSELVFVDYSLNASYDSEVYNVNSKNKLLVENINLNPQVYDAKQLYTEDYGTIYLNKDKEITSGYRMNITNIYGIKLLEILNVDYITLSIELNYDKIRDIIEAYREKFDSIPNLAIYAYGNIDAMTLKYCPINSELGNSKKQNCNLCRVDKYHVEIGGRLHKLRGDMSCNVHIYNDKLEDETISMVQYKKLGISKFIIDLTNEPNKEDVLKKLGGLLI